MTRNKNINTTIIEGAKFLQKENVQLKQQLSSLQADNERLREALKVAMVSLGTYGRHPLIENQANKALQNK